MRSPELEKILDDHSLWLRTEGREGTRLDLSGADLSSAELSDANLSGANMTGTNLSGADLTRAELSITGLTRADLYGAIMDYADSLPLRTDDD